MPILHFTRLFINIDKPCADILGSLHIIEKILFITNQHQRDDGSPYSSVLRKSGVIVHGKICVSAMQWTIHICSGI